MILIVLNQIEHQFLSQPIHLVEFLSRNDRQVPENSDTRVPIDQATSSANGFILRLFYGNVKISRLTKLVLTMISLLAQHLPDILSRKSIIAYHFPIKNAKMEIARKLKIRGQKCYK